MDDLHSPAQFAKDLLIGVGGKMGVRPSVDGEVVATVDGLHCELPMHFYIVADLDKYKPHRLGDTEIFYL